MSIEDVVQDKKEELDKKFDKHDYPERQFVSDEVDTYYEGLQHGEWRAEERHKIAEENKELILDERIIMRGNIKTCPGMPEEDVTQEYIDSFERLSEEYGSLMSEWDWDISDDVEISLSVRRVAGEYDPRQEERLFDDQGRITDDSARIDPWGEYKF